MKCIDKNCKRHGIIATRGRAFVGTVTAAKMNKTITVEWERRRFLPKYERFEKRRSKIKAHNPECMEIAEGDKVMVQECKPLSKTKKFVVIKKL